MTMYYVRADGNVHGPFDGKKLKDLARAGKIARSDQISKDGKTGWVPASNVRGLSFTDEPAASTSGSTAIKSLSAGVRRTLPSGFTTRRRRIAITGLANTGKTVFLTTLINHLKHHDPGNFRLFDSEERITVQGFTETDPTDQIDKFEYELFNHSLRTGRWPQKTVDVSSYTCQFHTDRHWLNYQVEFLDWPGERLADVMMYKRDYAAWSDDLLKRWDVAQDIYRRHVAPYLAVSRHLELTEKSVLTEYKLALARLILDSNPLISPSCFLVGQDGNRLRGTTPEQLAAEGMVGIGGQFQFAPLPDQTRLRHPALAAAFSQRYSDYRRQVVERLFGAVRWCNRLIVLVDIPTILGSGLGRLNDNYEMIDELLKVLGAQSNSALTIGKKLWHKLAPASWMWMGVEKIAFVATKADLVAGEQNRDNLQKLLDLMLRDIKNRIPGVQIKSFSASPVSSTKPGPGGSGLLGKPMFDGNGSRRAPDAPELVYEVSPVPDMWPDSWARGQYHYPPVYPTVPQGRFVLPKSIGLDNVMRFILE